MPHGIALASAGANPLKAGRTGTCTNKNDVLSLDFDSTADTFGCQGGSFTLNVVNVLTFARYDLGNNEAASAQNTGALTDPIG